MAQLDEMVVYAADKSEGMTMDEVTTAMTQASNAGFTTMGRTRVGFRGQIQEMVFKRPGQSAPASKQSRFSGEHTHE